MGLDQFRVELAAEVKVGGRTGASEVRLGLVGGGGRGYGSRDSRAG